jgi:zinc protease
MNWKTTMAAGPLAAALLLVPVAEAQVKKNWKEITNPPLREFRIQQPKRVELPNGLVIFLQEHRELPLVQGTAIIRGGSREEAASKIGLASIFGQSWRTGGTKTRTGDQLDEFLEMRGATVETSSDVDSSSVTFDTLKQDLDPVFNAWVDLLKNPEFREDKITLAKTQLNTGIARRNDNPAQIADREALRIGYGRDSVYARVPEYATVASVQRQDLLDWHRRFVHPNNMIIGVYGDFDSKAMEAKLRSAFGSMPRGPEAKTPEVEFPEPRPGIYFVNRDDVNQSNIRMVHMGVRRDNPDYYALQVFNEALGGGFSARLFSNIRSKKGLAYSVGGGVGSNYDHPGLVRLQMGTKSESTAAAIEALHEEVDDITRKPFTAEELQRSKESILNSFIFRYDSKAKVLNERMLLEFYDYPADFIEKFRASVDKVTTDDLLRVGRKYVGRDKFAIVVVGKQSDFDKPLSTFGAVSTIDIAIPEGTAPAPASSSSAGTTPEGRALINRVVESYGGAGRLASLAAIRRAGSASMVTPQGAMQIELDAVEVWPDRSVRKMKTQMGEMTMVVTGDAGFMSMGAMGSRDLPPSQRESMSKEIRRDPIFIARQAASGSYVFTAGGAEAVNGVETQVLNVSGGDTGDQKWNVDANGRIVRVTRTSMEQGTKTETVVDFSDFKTIDGVTVPMTQIQTRNGEKAGEVRLREVQLNPTVDPKSFEKPAN